MNRYKEICIALDRVRPEHNWLSYSISANIEVLCRKYKRVHFKKCFFLKV